MCACVLCRVCVYVCMYVHMEVGENAIKTLKAACTRLEEASMKMTEEPLLVCMCICIHTCVYVYIRLVYMYIT